MFTLCIVGIRSFLRCLYRVLSIRKCELGVFSIQFVHFLLGQKVCSIDVLFGDQPKTGTKRCKEGKKREGRKEREEERGDERRGGSSFSFPFYVLKN